MMVCHLVCTRGQLFQLRLDLDIVINWKNLDLESRQKAKYLGMLFDTVEERVFPRNFRISKFKVKE